MRQARAGHRLSWDRVLAGVMLAGIAGLAGWGLSIELQASPIQSRLFSKMASGFHYSVEPGPNRDARFPKPDRTTSGLGTLACPHSSTRSSSRVSWSPSRRVCRRN